MFGRIVFSETNRVTLRYEELDGIPVQTVCIPARSPTPRRIRKAARILYRCGVRRVLVPSEFSYWPQLKNCGILPVDTVPFLQAMAVPLALAFFDGCGISPGRATVVLAGRRASKALRDAAVALCPGIHQLVISAPSGGAGLADYLRREYGLPLLEQCQAPHLILLFAPVELESRAPVLRLHDPAPDLLGISMRPKSFLLPDGCETVPFLAALWESGRLAIDDLAVFPCEDT